MLLIKTIEHVPSLAPVFPLKMNCVDWFPTFFLIFECLPQQNGPVYKFSQ